MNATILTVPDELIGAINKTRTSLNIYATTAQEVVASQEKHAARLTQVISLTCFVIIPLVLLETTAISLGFTHEQARHLTSSLLEEMHS